MNLARSRLNWICRDVVEIERSNRVWGFHDSSLVILVRHEEAVDQFTDDVTDHDVSFLNPGSITARDSEEHFDQLVHLAARFAGQSNGVHPFRACDFDSAQDIWRI